MFLNGFSVKIPEGREDNGGYVALEHGKQYSLSLRNGNDRPCDAHVEIDGRPIGTWRIDAGRAIRLERPVHDTGRFTFYVSDSAEAVAAQLDASDPNYGLIKVVFTPGILQHVASVPSYPQYPRWNSSNPRPLDPQRRIRWTAGNKSVDVDDSSWQAKSLSHTGPTDNEGTAASVEGVAFAGIGRSEGAQSFNAVSSASYVAPTAEPTTRGGAYQSGGTGLSGMSLQTYGQAPLLVYDYSGQTTIHLRLVGVKPGPRPLTSYSTPVPPRF